MSLVCRAVRAPPSRRGRGLDWFDCRQRPARRAPFGGAFMTLAEDLEEEFGAGLGKRHIAEFVDDKQFDGDELRLQFEETPFVARFHQLEPGRREEGDREAALASGQAERQTRMRLARAGITQSNHGLLQATKRPSLDAYGHQKRLSNLPKV